MWMWGSHLQHQLSRMHQRNEHQHGTVLWSFSTTFFSQSCPGALSVHAWLVLETRRNYRLRIERNGVGVYVQVTCKLWWKEKVQCFDRNVADIYLKLIGKLALHMCKSNDLLKLWVNNYPKIVKHIWSMLKRNRKSYTAYWANEYQLLTLITHGYWNILNVIVFFWCGL